MKTVSNVLVPSTQRAASKPSLDVFKIREDFPILKQQVGGKPLVYFDNAATVQKPRHVIDAISRFYSEDYSNIHRGVHTLSQRSTHAYEAVRTKVQRLINASEDREIIFVRGTTEGNNLVAHGFARPRLEAGDEILISGLEHHSNIVPWQMLCEEKGARLQVIPINDDGEILLEECERRLSSKTKLLCVAHVSNALGTVNPVHRIVELAHRQQVPVLIDGAQAVPHFRVDVRDLDCDFYTFSGHKVYGPTGIGVLYGKAGLLEAMSPFQGGGDMIASVTFEKTTYNKIPHKFEAGTPDIAGVIGLGAAIDYVNSIGMEAIAAYERELLEYATEAVSKIQGVRILGTAKEKAAVLSFVLEGVHPHDIGTILDQEGIAIRAGHHCAQPVMDRFGVPATARVSFALYNTKEEIDVLVKGIRTVMEVFG
jgi:cysteine desulfurase/selenocysteine lyase